MQIDNILNIGLESYKAENLNLFGEVELIGYRFMMGDKPFFETKGKSLDECRAALKIYLRQHSVCFSGHRTLKTDTKMLMNQLAAELQFCYRKGFRVFIAGGAVGFDMLAAEAVLEFKKTHQDVILIIAVPFPEQTARFCESDKGRYNVILDRADFFIVLSAGYYDGCYLRRNDFMLANSSYMIAYWDGKSFGGTSYTCRKALSKKGFHFQNLL